MILAKTFSRLAQSQAQGGLQQALAARIVKFDGHLLELRHVRDDFIEKFAEIFPGRQRIIQDGNFFFQLSRNFQHR